METAARQKWTLTLTAFDALLAALGPDREIAANRYLEIRGNLVRLFEWRGCPAPDEYADEAINRCARKIGEGEEVRDIASYCVGIGRMMLREMARQPAGKIRPLEEAPEPRTLPPDPVADVDRREECLRHCLQQLPAEDRELILLYYQGEGGDKIKNRKALSERFDLPGSALRMRALRLREKLQLCAERCLQKRDE